ncbi:hypothetical protein [Bradyrhizobium prioriisuperbiae]|uniref:hypothetical protein n=1 Tax=Bradyrhizobium prioriisuperbiae TaxID=2854389 RepID=UPI0028E8E7B5|nr:hypothetical protein [Bradyrhizobium prioritasuperba]
MMRRGLSFTARGVALATVAALALTMFEPVPVLARDAGPAPATASAGVVAASGATDFSAARRRYRRGGGNNAAAIAAFGAFAGIIGGAIAESQRRDYYRERYYDGGPGYYGRGYGYGGPGYYGGGPRYYGGW